MKSMKLVEPQTPRNAKGWRPDTAVRADVPSFAWHGSVWHGSYLVCLPSFVSCWWLPALWSTSLDVWRLSQQTGYLSLCLSPSPVVSQPGWTDSIVVYSASTRVFETRKRGVERARALDQARGMIVWSWCVPARSK